MIEPLALLHLLQSREVTFFAGVPDSLLKDFCACLADHVAPADHLVAANEGGAVAAAVGHHLATGRTPLVYMQNSGLGNALNPLLSLADPAVYAIPMLLMIGWRGEPGVPDEPQHRKQGAVTLALLDAIQLPYTIIDAQTRPIESLVDGVLQQRRDGPHALVVRQGTFGTYRRRTAPVSGGGSLRRQDAIAEVVDGMERDDLVIATTGLIGRELYAHRVRRGQGHERDFLVIGGMGHASQIAHTLAAHHASRQVYCLDGDAAFLMHMGALAIIGAGRAANFRHIVLNNGAHESVGGQPTVGFAVDLPALARSAGYPTAARVTAPSELPHALRELRGSAGPGLLEVRVAVAHQPDPGRPTLTPVDAKNSLMHGLR